MVLLSYSNIHLQFMGIFLSRYLNLQARCLRTCWMVPQMRNLPHRPLVGDPWQGRTTSSWHIQIPDFVFDYPQARAIMR